MPVQIGDDAWRGNKPERYGDCNPAVAVNPSGVVGVMWYDRRENGNSPGYWTRFTASLDGGETFLPSVKVSQAPSSFQVPKLTLSGPRVGHRESFVIGVNFRQFSAGDTSGLTASPDGVFHALWVDNRTGVPQVWTAPVMVAAHAVRNGSNELAPLKDVGDRATLLLGRPIYDRENGVIRVDARLENTSKKPIRGPVKIRLLSLSSRLGEVSVVHSDNNVEGVGVVWDLTQQLENGALKPSARSKAKLLEFRLIEDPDATGSYEALVNMIQLRVKVLAGGIRSD